jgi:hypothetical protein
MKRKRSHALIEEDDDNIFVPNNKDNKLEEKKWLRKTLPNDFDAKKQSINFQKMDITYVIEEAPLSSHCSKRTIEKNVPIIKMFGCTDDGYSVALSIYNFMPYIFVPIPSTTIVSLENEESVCSSFQKSLEV